MEKSYSKTLVLVEFWTRIIQTWQSGPQLYYFSTSIWECVLNQNLSNIHTSPVCTAEFGFQHKMRLSLPQLNRRSGSLGHQAMESIPRWWLSRLFSGEVANLKSHNCMTGEWSSSLAKHIWVATSGCQATNLHLIYRKWKHKDYWNKTDKNLKKKRSFNYLYQR